MELYQEALLLSKEIGLESPMPTAEKRPLKIFFCPAHADSMMLCVAYMHVSKERAWTYGSIR